MAHHHHHNTRSTRTTTRTTTTTTRRRGGGLFGRKKVHHQKRKPTMGDKIAGAMKKLKGTITHNPAEKAAGTRRMHGTDGRGSHRY
ncbi:hypothetical protein BD289DRAFT_378435 [Coniella lustricola]|uniref:Uncharacterized protein n=1 Tax=Coniella lustricola TaxID=2025994 RepID=A0A2T2ZU29_9PEZI|nr:hypothetical protein BD289DRAFT_378435 [Coniella lustricola]